MKIGDTVVLSPRGRTLLGTYAVNYEGIRIVTRPYTDKSLGVTSDVHHPLWPSWSGLECFMPYVDPFETELI